MKNYNNIFILGTSHVSKDSIEKVKRGIDEVSPSLVAVELDRNRAIALKSESKKPRNIDLIRHIGIWGFALYVLGDFAQREIGRILDITPGAEMLAAMEIAKEKGITVALIDRDIRVTLRRFSKNFRKRELLWIFVGLLPFRKRSNINFQLDKVPSEDVIETIISHTKKKYPSIYKVLIEERDIYMANNLHALSRMHSGRIFAVVGAGHVKGIINHLSYLDAAEK